MMTIKQKRFEPVSTMEKEELLNRRRKSNRESQRKRRYREAVMLEELERSNNEWKKKNEETRLESKKLKRAIEIIKNSASTSAVQLLLQHKEPVNYEPVFATNSNNNTYLRSSSLSSNVNVNEKNNYDDRMLSKHQRAQQQDAPMEEFASSSNEAKRAMTIINSHPTVRKEQKQQQYQNLVQVPTSAQLLLQQHEMISSKTLENAASLVAQAIHNPTPQVNLQTLTQAGIILSQLLQ